MFLSVTSIKKIVKMCTNLKEVMNVYTHQTLYASCGKCPSCLQAKANKRMERIMSHVPAGFVPLFFHLTYNQEHIPYFYAEDLELTSDEFRHVPIYRGEKIRWFYNRWSQQKYKIHDNTEYWLDDYFYDNCSPEDIDKLYLLPGNKVGVLYYPDIQNFFKRLRVNLDRYANDYPHIQVDFGRITYFVCGEYGISKTDHQRPHWHIILYVPLFERQYLYEWASLIADSWLYADRWLTEDNVEFAIAAASYASSYVNCGSDVSNLLQTSDFRPRWHWSQDFGFDFDNFALPNILSCVERRLLQYPRKVVDKSGLASVRTYPLPKYVTNRWFPPFKGLRNFTYEEITELLSNPFRCYESSIRQRLGFVDFQECKRFVETLSRYVFRFQKAYFDYGGNVKPINYKVDLAKDFNLSSVTLMYHQYAWWYVQFLRAKANTLFSYQYDFKKPSDYVQKYYNIKQFRDEHKKSRYKGPFVPLSLRKYIVDPNEFVDVVESTYRLEQTYNNKVKNKNINQLCRN